MDAAFVWTEAGSVEIVDASLGFRPKVGFLDDPAGACHANPRENHCSERGRAFGTRIPWILPILPILPTVAVSLSLSGLWQSSLSEVGIQIVDTGRSVLRLAADHGR